MTLSITFTAGQLLRMFRRRRKMSLKEVADGCTSPSLSKRTIQRIEADSDFTHLQLASLARSIGLSDDETDAVARAARAGGGAS